LKFEACPQDFDVFLQALWLDGHGDWQSAHHLVNDLSSSEAAWLHAYLHRKEGDLSNADYWYRRAGKPWANQSLKDEWHTLVSFFCSR